MYIQFLRFYFSHRFWILTFIVLSAFSITSVTYAAPNEQSNPEGYYYYVSRGDTLSQIAKSHGVSVEELIYFNSLKKPDLIRVGAPLYIPANSDSDISTCNQHTVTAGQTLSGIAANYNVHLQELAEINSIYDVDHIRVGMKICIPPADVSSSGDSNGVSDDTLGTVLLRKDQATDRVYTITNFRPHVLLASSDSPIEIEEDVQFVLLGDILLAQYSAWFGHSDGELDVIGHSDLGRCLETNRTWEIISEPVMTRIDSIPGAISSKQSPIKHMCLFRSAIDWPTLEAAIQHELGTSIWENLENRMTNRAPEQPPVTNYIITKNVNEVYSLHTFSFFRTDPASLPPPGVAPIPGIPSSADGTGGSAGNASLIAECKADGCDPSTCSGWACWWDGCCYIRR